MIEVWHGDITEQRVDAIVTAANAQLAGGGGVDGAVHRAAGPELLEACRKLGSCATGDAVRTPGFRLQAPFVIHAVGPIWRGGGQDEERLLRAAYVAAFARAKEPPRIRSLAFPAISTGVYGFPGEEAAAIAVKVFREHEADFERIVACVFDAETEALYRKHLMTRG